MNFSNTLKELKLISKGDHMVLLYDNDEYNAEIIAAYIGSRVMRNEKCLYIAGDDDQKLLLEKLNLLIDTEKAIYKGHISIFKQSDAYSKDGSFNPDNMIALIKKMSLEAIEQGYDAFAVTGEISWVLQYESGFEKIMEYEYKLNNEIFGTYPVSAVCRYNLNKFSSEMIKHIIDVHQIIIWEGEVHHNPFYFDVVDTNHVNIHDFQVESMLRTISSFTNTKSKFYNELQEKENENQLLQLDLMKNIIISLTSLLEIHDKYTKNHSENVAKIAKQIALAMGLPEEEVSKIYFAGLVHDIGKTIIPHDILIKKEKLTEEEFELIKKHSHYGYKSLSKTPVLKSIAELVLHHHERVDGKGYPSKIIEKNIPLGSRILCIADSYDAMVNNRPYRKAMSKKDAIAELKRCAGTQFDKKIVEICLKTEECLFS
ncbi:MAG TPA: HD domain-containing protein [Treponema sp.]|nr:HD domain-containing protein [Treponema sp.]